MPMTRATLPIDGRRLWADLMALAEMTDPDRPYTRRSFSPRFLEGREWLGRRFDAAGLSVRLDPAGNLIGRADCGNPMVGTIMIGSHSDTVPGGGRFDGIAGVVAALEIARSMNETGIRLRHHLEVVDFLAEEPSEFGLSCIGSRGMAGQLERKLLGYANASGEHLEEAINRVGGKTLSLAAAVRRDIVAFFELHIEQGIVLETRKIDLGLVTAIAGITRIEIVFSGSADHAGTTPMELRRDALVAAAELATFIAQRARGLAKRGNGHFVATCGILDVKPNAANVVPGEARLVIDARSDNRALVEEFRQLIDEAVTSIAERCRVECSRNATLSDTMPAVCDRALLGLLDASASDLGFTTMEMASGAGHDAAFISRIAPAAMLFIPCRNGKSHAPEEWAEPEALSAGTAVMGEAVLRFDRNHGMG
jgi:beta-ureidopropionase / N-carbamoyl-L-amino-acid hydrolase